MHLLIQCREIIAKAITLFIRGKISMVGRFVSIGEPTAAALKPPLKLPQIWPPIVYVKKCHFTAEIHG